MNSFFVWPLSLFLMQSRVASAGDNVFEADCEKLIGSAKVAVMPLCIRTSFLSRTVRIQSNLHAVGSLLSVLSIRRRPISAYRSG